MEPEFMSNGVSAVDLEPASTQYELLEPPRPKPSVGEIKDLHARFYGAIAKGFDEFNAKSTRGLYFNAVNQAIVDELLVGCRRGSETPDGGVKRVISIAAGTGSREESIRKLSGLNFEVTCVDISPEMCEIASQRGFYTVCAALPDAHLASETYDACVFLNGFEVLVNHAERLQYLQAISRSLKTGGLFFVDAMDIDDTNDPWAVLVKDQFFSQSLSEFGYELGDCFCRRTDQEAIVFAHYSSQTEMERLFQESKFKVRRLQHFSEETGGACNPHEGNMFFVVEK
jgi:SAM-dependent methyltransferase